MIKKILLTLTVVVGFTGLTLLNREIRPDFYAYQKSVDYQPEIISEKAIKYLGFGFENLLADFYWLDAVQYMGGHVRDGKIPALKQYLLNISTLDPKFVYPHKINLIINSDYDSKGAIEIAKKGMYDNPDAWEIPFYLGYLYGFQLKEYRLGAAYFQLSSTKPGVVKAAYALGPALLRQTGDLERSLEYWLIMADTTKDNEELKKAKFEITRITNMMFLRDATKAYKEKFKKDPDFYMHDLVKARFIKEIPKDPLDSVGYGWYPDEQIVKITVGEGK